MSKRRRGFPSESQVKRGVRIVHSDKELFEKLGRNDLCPCGSGKRFKKCCRNSGCFRRRQPGPLLLESEEKTRQNLKLCRDLPTATLPDGTSPQLVDPPSLVETFGRPYGMVRRPCHNVEREPQSPGNCFWKSSLKGFSFGAVLWAFSFSRQGSTSVHQRS